MPKELVEVLAEQSPVAIPKRRPGRPKGSVRWYTARGIHPLTAAQVLAEVGDERKLWRRVLSSEDDRVVLQAIVYLTSMRDGKPAQQINVTSTSIHLKPGDIERARMIAREIRGEIGPLETSAPSLACEIVSAETITPGLTLETGSPLQVDEPGAPGLALSIGPGEGEGKANIMLGEGEGGK